jgi:hypothetical protein
MSDIAVKSATTASKETWSEDWLSVIIGVLVFALALFNLSIALAPVANAGLDGVTALLLTYASLLVVLSAGVAALGADVRKFALSFTVVFADRLCELDRGLLCLYCRGHAGPARIKADIAVPRPDPRHRGDPYLAELRRQILGLLGLDTTW